MQYWINVVSKDHVLAGMAGGFTQAHGDRAAQLELLERGDLIFFYSPGTLFRAGEILQAFTAVAQVIDHTPYTAPSSGDPHPLRRNTIPLPCEEASVAPLVPQLDFITDKANWGASLPRGLFPIGEADARRIAEAMKADLPRS
jgi:hypothetical protein